ncbi:double cortin and calcium/calmodulin-dependent protein kinase-like 1, isoform CRA_d [Rattus norvegicus]|uniref:Double cortin and calcium/calmodulin-dependent protein kinase-like 1, isoform CRA_d n=1 Tax=Rattus norvegicus TaxID=10116 RepID=A6JVF4_RAT|nr:double cortin and calcium/calmodulin-dependent protein kinase-like 1, isoform CRA_d [Rattus norvegicus]
MSRSDPVVCQPQSSSDTYAPLPSSEGTRPPLPCSRTELYFCFHLKELNSKSLVLKKQLGMKIHKNNPKR